MLLNYFSAYFSAIWNGSITQLIISIIDILLVYFFAYKFFVLIKGTRSVQILAGFFLLLILYFIGNLMGMRATSWVLSGIFDSFIIIAIVLFRDEIRNILSSIQLMSLFKRSESMLESMLVSEELSETLGYLASQREGAIVIVAQKGDPSQFTSGGVSIDANVRKELLISIFKKNTPLHDGAVIIANGRIKMASAVLPLSTNPEIDPNFGTRHRAAYGISERVDALVFVVSEERGQISMMKEGGITRNMTKEMVKKVLTKHLQKD